MFLLNDYDYPCFKNVILDFDYTVRSTAYDTQRIEFENHGNFFEQAQFWDERDDEKTLRVVKFGTTYNEKILENTEICDKYEHIIITDPDPVTLCKPLELLTRGVISKGQFGLDICDILHFLDSSTKKMYFANLECESIEGIDKIYNELKDRFESHEHHEWTNVFFFMRMPQSFTSCDLAEFTDKLAKMLNINQLFLQTDFSLDETDEHIEVDILYGGDVG